MMTTLFQRRVRRVSFLRTNYGLRITNYLMICAISSSFFTLACKKEEVSTVKRPSCVILISIDTLRADYLKLYDPTKGVATPNIEEVAREGAVFRNAISQVPYTLPSHATMLTGVYPAAHRIRDNVRDTLPSGITTLAEMFKKNGYQTAGFAGSMVLSQQTGIARGFDYFDDFFSRGDVHAEDLGGIERKAEEVVQSFEYWMEHRSSQSPFFAFIHFYDPHSPYTPPSGYSASNRLEDLYSGEIKYADFALGKLFAGLKKSNNWNDSVVLITSDHGEMLNEHGELGHGFFLYQPALVVPLILRAQGIKPNSVNDLVEIVDIAPTLLDVTGIKIPIDMQGESLLPIVKEGRKKKNRSAFAESYFASLQFGISPLKMIQDNNLKYIEAPVPELYELTSGADEKDNLAGSRKSDVQKFRTRLSQFEKANARNYEKEQRNVSAEEAEQFAAIGYLSGQIPESKWDLKKDPKDFIDEWTTTLEATTLVNQRQFAKALPMIREIANKAAMPSSALLLLEAKCYAGLGDLSKSEQTLKPISDTPEALTTLAQINFDAGRKTQAEQLYSKALEKEFSYFTVFNYILLLRETGQKEKAISYLKNVRSSRKDTERSLPFFAEMYIALEDWSGAEQTLQQLVQNRPWESKWFKDLAMSYQAQGKIQNAIQILSANQDRFKEDPEYQLRYGIVLNRAGQKANEIAVFQEFIRKWPADARGYFYLAKALLDANQDPSRIGTLAQKGLSLEPDAEMTIFGYFLLGNAYERLGRSQEAREAFAMAERLEKGTK
ncbi:MAG TPA: sulfatase-like hydrolase/transferase [Acidobacteriota bacterium]|nr:sulfatase-like hydrolase/transferase [Acidobacteriota bacterium]